MSGRLSAIEAAYVALEGRGSPIHIGSVAIFDAGPLLDRRGALRIGELRARIESRLDLLPRLRQRVMRVPLELGRPVWMDDPTFDIGNHVDVVELPAPGDERMLARLAADLHMRPFPSNRPMWRLSFVTGLTGNRVALVERVHHAMVDGASGVDVATALLDVNRRADPTTPSTWVAARPPSAGQLVLGSVTDQTRAIRGLAVGTATALLHPGSMVGRVGDVVRAVGGIKDHGLLAPRSSLNRPTGSDRSMTFVRQELDPIRAAGRAAGATVNDVVLSAVAGGLRSLFLARGESLPHERDVTVMVPVSLRDDAERATLGNRVGVLMVPLPVGIGDSHARLRAIAEVSATMKARRDVVTSQLVQAVADFVPAPLVAPLSGLITRQPLANLVVTNVPGPPFPLYAMGAEMLDAFPIVPLAGNLTLGVAALSYNGALNLGVTADSAACPDVGAFVSGVENSFVQLRELGKRPASSSTKPKPPADAA